MDINWLGHCCFRLRGRSATVVTDPFGADAGARAPRLEANLVTVSHHDAGQSQAAGVAGASYVIDGPGEYEVAGVPVHGIAAYRDVAKGAERGRNTVYVIELDDVRICHLGDLGHRLDEQQIEALGLVDVLLVPVGSGDVLPASEAAALARAIEPRYVVPMRFSPGSGEGAATFLREMGVAALEPQGKLNVQASSGEFETRVVLLEARQ